MRTLVAYFSAEGTTAAYADALAGAAEADIFEIVPEPPYSKEDINWRNPLSRCNREKIGKKDVPFKGSVEDWDNYEMICLGFPIWYYGAPNVINTFCKAYDWAGKKVIIFATSGGSDIGRTVEKLRPYMKGAPDMISAAVYTDAEALNKAVAGAL